MERVHPPFVPIGEIKTFGRFGPKYIVGQPLRRLDNDDWMIQITLPESGEVAEYFLSHIRHDPPAT